MRKAVVVLLLLFASMFCLCAKQGSITWYWFQNDPNVQYYRYQVDGEIEENWAIVRSNVEEVTIILDASVPHVLYLQQSYDGVHWSQSSMAESEVLVEVEPLEDDDVWFDFDDETYDDWDPESENEDVDFFPEETAETAEAESEMTEEAAENTAEEAVAETAKEEPAQESGYQAKRNLDLAAGYLNHLPDTSGPMMIGLTFSFESTFFKASNIDIGLKVNLAMHTSVDIFSDYTTAKLKEFTDVLAIASATVASSDVYLGIGPSLSLGFVNDEVRRVGFCAEVGVRFHRTHKLSFGLALSDRVYLYPLDDKSNVMELRLSVGTRF